MGHIRICLILVDVFKTKYRFFQFKVCNLKIYDIYEYTRILTLQRKLITKCANFSKVMKSEFILQGIFIVFCLIFRK